MREIEGYPDYLVTESGKVFSRKKLGETKEISPVVSRDGYFKVRLTKDGKRTKLSVHRLVAAAFIEKPKGAVMVRHLDDVKTNNHVSNLAWGDAKDNAADMIRNGKGPRGRKLNVDRSGDRNPNVKLNHEQVLEIRKRWDERVTLASLAREYGVEYPTIASIVKGRLWSRLVRRAPQLVETIIPKGRG